MDLATLEIVYDTPEQREKDFMAIRGVEPLLIKANCNTSGDKTRGNVLSAVKRGLPVVSPGPALDVRAVLVGGGPSLRRNWEEVKQAQEEGAHIFALNGVAKFLNERGIIPNYQVILDPRPDNIKLIGTACVYLMASQCAPEVLNALPIDRTGLFHCLGSSLPAGEDPVIRDGTVKSLVNGYMVNGCTVGLAAMCVANMMGYKSLSLYGYDSSFEHGVHHAYPQEQTDQEQKRTEVIAFDRRGKRLVFQTNISMAQQAEFFGSTVSMLLADGADIEVHGDGLIPTIAGAMAAQQSKQAAE